MLTMTQTKPVLSLAPKRTLLAGMEIFRDIPFHALREIEKDTLEKKYDRKAFIFRENDPALSIWFVKQGHVKEVNHSTDGKIQTVGMVGPGGMFGVSSFDGGEYGFCSVAETDVTVAAFPIQVFRTLMGQYPDLARVVISKISKLLRQSKNRQTVSQECAEKRLLHVLMEMTEEFGSTIPLTHREIASMAGISPETCSRIFSRLEAAGLITARHGRFTVNHVDDLKTRMKNF
jgi:CRP-like cAMP-binding protein